MSDKDPNNEPDSGGQSMPQPELELRAKLQQAKGELTDYARGQAIDLSRPRLTREQLYDRKLARLEMAVSDLRRELGIES